MKLPQQDKKIGQSPCHIPSVRGFLRIVACPAMKDEVYFFARRNRAVLFKLRRIVIWASEAPGV
jgi:hypothetical protein